MKKIIKISDAEWHVMNLLWEKGPITSSQIVITLGLDIGWSPTTIYTLISRLAKKQAIAVDNRSSPFVCRPLITQKEYRKQEGNSFLKKVYDGSLNLFMMNILEEEELTDDEIDELKNILDNSKNKER